MSVYLLKAAVKYAGANKAIIVERYPYDLTGRKSPLPDPFVYTGLQSAYVKAVFKEVARRSETRPFMRFMIKKR